MHREQRKPCSRAQRGRGSLEREISGERDLGRASAPCPCIFLRSPCIPAWGSYEKPLIPFGLIPTFCLKSVSLPRAAVTEPSGLTLDVRSLSPRAGGPGRAGSSLKPGGLAAALLPGGRPQSWNSVARRCPLSAPPPPSNGILPGLCLDPNVPLLTRTRESGRPHRNSLDRQRPCFQFRQHSETPGGHGFCQHNPCPPPPVG